MTAAALRGMGLVLAATLLAACSSIVPGGDAEQPAPYDAGPRTSPRSGPDPESLREFRRQRVSWSACGDGFECARVAVPLDYERPGRDVIDLSVVRLPASGGAEKRLGSLLINPGGPGSSGIEYARQAERVINPHVRERFDIVGFDPRGVARSEPLKCLTDRQLDEFISADGSPDDPAEEQRLIELARMLAQGCEQRAGELLAHVATEDVARDLDVLRAVLGDERLHYLGKSYGTLLGATYAELFPQHVGRLVLDGAVDPTVSDEEFDLAQAEGFERALRAFVADCVEQDECPLSGSVDEGVQQVALLLERIDKHPLPSEDSDRRLTQALAVLGVVAALYDRTSGWPALRIALAQAERDDGTVLLRLADFYTDRDEDGDYATNQNEVFYAVNCLDGDDGTADVAELRSRADRYAASAPVFGPYLAWGAVACVDWPVPPRGEPGPLRAAGSAPILVVGTTRDPATPYAWAVGLADQLEAGVLLSWDGDGHTAYGRGSSCIDAAVDDYLVAGEVPEDGTRCE